MENKELPIGSTLQAGQYTIESVIGIGGFGITYYVRHNTLGGHFAIKEFFIGAYCMRNTLNRSVLLQGIDDSTYEKHLQKFIEEAQTLNRLDHPNIVRAIDIFQENNTAYLVMPFLEGHTLQQIVDQNGRLDYETAVNYIAQLSNAVDYIHHLDILHRDIKPGNIIITPENKAILIDFGSAREFVHDKTQSHTSILTQGYAPLEQYSSSSRKGSYSDIYSLGAIFYFALTGHKPMDAAIRTMETMQEPKELASNIPDEANGTIIKAMQLNPEQRYQRVSEFMADLLNIDATIDNIGNKAERVIKKVIIISVGIIIGTLLLYGSVVYYPNQKKQKEFEEKEGQAYKKAIDTNTIEGYTSYLREYPNGKNVQRIRLLEEQRIEERRRDKMVEEARRKREYDALIERKKKQHKESICNEKFAKQQVENYWSLNYPDREITSEIKITNMQSSDLLYRSSLRYDCVFNVQFKYKTRFLTHQIVAKLTFVASRNYDEFRFDIIRESSSLRSDWQ